MLKFLMDENVDPVYAVQLRHRQPNLVIRSIGDPATPPKGTLEPEILIWCEDNDFVLVTNNRTSIPQHLADHIEQDRHVPGILILNPNSSIGETIDELILIAEAVTADELQDRLDYLPIA